MIKHVQLTFEEHEFNKLKDKKGSLTWEQFVLTLLNKEVNNEKEYSSI